MTKNKSSTANNIDGNIVLLTKVLLETNKRWIEEINSDGDIFDYDSQDIYRLLLDEIFLNSNIVEKINPEYEKESRQSLFEELVKRINENIKLFKNHSNLFYDLPRKKILTKEFKERRRPKSTSSDEDLHKNFTYLKEIQNRRIYFESNLYSEIGFLEHNYHEQIYNYCIQLKAQLERKADVNNYNSNYLMTSDTIFLNMGIVYHIHDKYNGILFEHISELELYKSLNLQNTIPYVKVKDTRKILYLIYKLRCIINKSDHEFWLKGILKEIGIKKSYYQSAYKAGTWDNASESLKYFVEELDSLFKKQIATIIL